MNSQIKTVVLAAATLAFATSLLVPSQGFAQKIKIEVIKSSDGDQEVVSNDKKKPVFRGKRPAVDVAILLDTSNSMDGLISQAKSQLWKMVQQFANAKQAGKTPILRVSVFEYGNTNLPAAEGYIRQVVPLTDDLDKVSEALFALQTNGGDEYCGMVIAECLKRLDWSGEPNAYKVIFIAGNEPFTQGEVDYQDACESAIGQGVVVNTIHCGDYQTGVNGKWKHAAELAEGEYLNIDQDKKVVTIKAPQDRIIIELNQQLNETYLWFGAENDRKAYRTNQFKQDSNAAMADGLSSRIATKAGAVYRNVGRDLVDSFEENPSSIAAIPVDQLPQSMQSMSPEQRTEHVKQMAQRRAEIRKQIAEASKERVAFVEAQAAALPAAADESGTFGSAFRQTIEKQLTESGFEVQP